LGLCAGNVYGTGQGETAGLQNIPHGEIYPASETFSAYKECLDITKGIGDIEKIPSQLVKYFYQED
jgi:altronate dehydratase